MRPQPSSPPTGRLRGLFPPRAGAFAPGVMALVGLCAVASAEPPSRVKLLTSDVPSPIAVVAAPGESRYLYIASRAGTVRVLERSSGLILPSPFLDVSAQVDLDVDNGLLGLAFDPGFAQNGYVYINYNNRAGEIVLERHQADPGAAVAEPGTATTIWRYARPLGHNGGWIGFSPINGLLYITSGDGGSGGTADLANRAQTIVDQPLGKILRIDPRADDFPADDTRNYAIPPSNPFVGVVGDDEIWAYGVRNPWRGSFDRLTGDFYFGDVGMDTMEEVNHEPAGSPGGRNYGWPCMEGTRCTGSTLCSCGSPALTAPFFEYGHSIGLAVTGGYVYRGTAIPALQGLYFFSDYLSGRYWAARVPADGGPATVEDRSSDFIPTGASTPVRFVASWGEDQDGELYLCSIGLSRVYKVVPFPCEPEVDVQPASQSRPVGSTITLRVLGVGRSPLTYQWLKDSSPVPVAPGGRITGADTATLTISQAQSGDSGEYSAILMSPCGTVSSLPAQISVFACTSADTNQDGQLGLQDLFDFLALYFAGSPEADFNQSGTISLQDVLDYLASYFAGCQG